MNAARPLARLEQIVDASAVAPRIDAMLPVGARPRQLQVRTLLLGMLFTAVDGRPAHLKRVHEALLGLPEAERRRLGVIAEWNGGPHPLTYRQVERSFALVAGALAKEHPDGTPSKALSEVLDALLEASAEASGQPGSSSLAVDWTDLEAWSRPPPRKGGECADGEASWGHRRGDAPGATDEAFFGYYLQAATTVKDEHGPQVPELVRRILLTSCHVDPPPAFVPVLQRMVADGHKIGDVLADSGYAYRVAEHWALPVRRLGASLIQDLHPGDRGPNGTHMGAICANGSLSCPASQGKLRCPLRPASMTLPPNRPEVLTPPQHRPTCCSQRTLTVPPPINAKTAQKHDYPSPSTAAPTPGARPRSAPTPPSRTPPPTTSRGAGAGSPG